MSRLASEESYSLGKHNTEARMRVEALNGDLLFVVTPATLNRTATAAAWTRNVLVRAENAAGEVHTWFNEAITTGVAVSDDSVAGTATIPSTTLTFVEGEVIVVVSGDAAAWVADEINTLTVAEYTGFAGQTVVADTSIETIIA